MYCGLFKTTLVKTSMKSERCYKCLEATNLGKLPQGFGFDKAVSAALLANTQDKQQFLSLHKHQFVTTVEENHAVTLMKKVSSKYVTIKMYHIAKLKTESITG